MFSQTPTAPGRTQLTEVLGEKQGRRVPGQGYGRGAEHNGDKLLRVYPYQCKPLFTLSHLIFQNAFLK